MNQIAVEDERITLADQRPALRHAAAGAMTAVTSYAFNEAKQEVPAQLCAGVTGVFVALALLNTVIPRRWARRISSRPWEL